MKTFLKALLRLLLLLCEYFFATLRCDSRNIERAVSGEKRREDCSFAVWYATKASCEGGCFDGENSDPEERRGDDIVPC